MDIAKNIKSIEIWKRVILIIFYMLIMHYFTAYLILIVSIFQFVHVLIYGKVNDILLQFSKSFCNFVLQVISYVTFSTEVVPFPFTAWPD